MRISILSHSKVVHQIRGLPVQLAQSKWGTMLWMQKLKLQEKRTSIKRNLCNSRATVAFLVKLSIQDRFSFLIMLPKKPSSRMR